MVEHVLETYLLEDLGIKYYKTSNLLPKSQIIQQNIYACTYTEEWQSNVSKFKYEFRKRGIWVFIVTLFQLFYKSSIKRVEKISNKTIFLSTPATLFLQFIRITESPLLQVLVLVSSAWKSLSPDDLQDWFSVLSGLCS